MLLVHPVHEVVRQLPLLIGSVVLGSATGNPLWSVAALALTVGYGVARWFTTTYRIDADAGPAARRGAAAQRAVGAAQQDSFGVDRRPAAAPAARADGAAGQHRAGGQGRRRVRARRGRAPTRCRGCARSCWPTRWPAPACRAGPARRAGAGAVAAVVAAVQPAELHRPGDDRRRVRAGVPGGMPVRCCRIRGWCASGLDAAERAGRGRQRGGRRCWRCVVASVVLSVLRSLVDVRKPGAAPRR